ncbi:MAG: hypothetical protein ACE5JG_05370 [Planctomycetota bacterium]
MENVKTSRLDKKYHDAVCRWRDTFLPDYPLLMDQWERFFPHEPCFRLCAYRQCAMGDTIEVGDDQGRPKFRQAGEMDERRANQLLKAIEAQASTEFGSIQQHQLTLSRAQDEQDQFWILRMMAEELRHGYQMFSLLLGDDWRAVSDRSGEEMVDKVLSMRTGSHVLGAFNVDFDSFVDNIVFCALIDRVGKYQLQMQKVSAYRPMGESMPPMLREEAFHLAAGVVPLRRWIQNAARDEGYVTLDMIQKALHKWFPRGLDMFGDERGGGSNVRLGLKPLKNAEALGQYVEEVQRLVDDLNTRFVRTRLPELSREEADGLIERVWQGETAQGIGPADLLRLPDVRFYRRRGVHAYRMYDIDGKPVQDLTDYRAHLGRHLPEVYPAGRDFKGYVDLMKKVTAGELTPEEAVPLMPNLSRVGGVCPCSRAVRWLSDEPAGGNGGGS